MPTKRKSNRAPASSSRQPKKPKPPQPEDLEEPLTQIDSKPSSEAAVCPSSSSSIAELEEADSEVEISEMAEETVIKPPKPRKNLKETKQNCVSSSGLADVELSEAKFVGEPVNPDEARRRWPKRYNKPSNVKGPNGVNNNTDDEEYIMAKQHFTKADVDGCVYDLYDDAHVKAGKDEPPYICKIIEMFEGVDGLSYFTAQWFYRATDTVINDCYTVDARRLFYSEVKDCNELECLLEKLSIVRFSLDIDPVEKSKLIDGCKYYCDTRYLLPYTTFVNYPNENAEAGSDNSSTISEIDNSSSPFSNAELPKTSIVVEQGKQEATLLDLYSGCGGMSTGLCLGAKLVSLNLVTRWAVDLNEHALKSLKLNHEETEVRVEYADDFLSLLKLWKSLCVHFKLVDPDGTEKLWTEFESKDETAEDEEDAEAEKDDADEEVYEVEKVIGIKFGEAKSGERKKLQFKVQWKGYGVEYDTWEPLEMLTGCVESIKEFVNEAFCSKYLPLPGGVDVVCGGPPCQGISGFNRFRNTKNPLDDEKNRQLSVFMEIVDYLKPKYVLMENVVDLLKFADGFLGRYALGRLVEMNYQARMGMMCAGAYGVPQYRMRVFLWGALPTETLPQFPLPTHDVVSKGNIPTKWEESFVAYNEGHNQHLRTKLLLKDALSDLPEVGNSDTHDEMCYGEEPQTDFQRFIRLSRDCLLGSSENKLCFNKTLYDHRPLKLNTDDYTRVCHVPREKGANYRNFPGVLVGADNKAMLDPTVDRVYLKSGRPLVPDYALSFVRGTSSKPFKRLWWDEIVSTVVTRAEPHNQAVLHPVQDRVLTIRENARLQGFPDYYQLIGPIKERYMQIGNAVAVPVSRALGYSVGLAYKGLASDEALFQLPEHVHLPAGHPNEEDM